MPRNSSKIEKLAINRVTDLFLSCDKIQPWLPQGDKEPLWDGFLYLYSSSEWTNRDMKGRVACQVKGRDSDSDSEKDSYSVDVCDLENYLRDGGVLFFVVHVDLNPSPIYWALLAPVDIRGYLANAKGQHSTTIKLEKMPVVRQECERSVFEFYEHCQLQRKESVDVAQIAKIGKFKTSFGVEPGELPILAFTKGYHYLYSCDDEGGFGAPVGDTQYAFQVEKDVAESIKIGEEEIKVSVKLKIREGRAFLEFDRFMTMDLRREDGTPCQLNYNADKLFGIRERDTALRVLLAMDAAEEFSIDGHPYSCAEISVPSETRAGIKEELNTIQKVIILLNHLHIKEDLCLSNLSDHDMRELNTLYGAIVENRLVKPKNVKNDYQVINVTIGPLTIKVWLVKDGDNYRVYDFFAADYVISVAADETGPKHEVGRFVLLEKQDYIKTSNIDWALIPSEYARIYKDDVELLHTANQDVLNMLLAYDECGKIEILDAVLRLSDWLIGASRIEDDTSIYKVNYLQAVKRKRSLSSEERRDLISLSDSSTASLELKYCCDLLLDDQLRAQYHFSLMDPENQAFYRNLPIHHFSCEQKEN